MTFGLPSVQVCCIGPVGDPPSVGGSHDPIVVVTADDVVVPAFAAREHVLALEMAAVRAGVAVDGHEVVADQMLRVVQSEDRSTDPSDDLVDALALDAAQAWRWRRA